MPISELTDVRHPLPNPGAPRLRNLPALTSIRFFAAFGVALYHMVKPPSRLGVLAPAVAAGYAGVSFFFVLSGFILTYSHAEEFLRGLGRPTAFWITRLARIYPLYLLVLLGAAYVNRAEFYPRIHILAYLADLLMVQSWSMRLVIFFNLPAWSLSVEAFLYLLFPFVLLRLRPSSRSSAYLMLALSWLLALAAPLACLYLYPVGSWQETGSGISQAGPLLLVRFLPPLALPEFLAGILLGWIYLQFDPGPRFANLLATVSLLVLAATLLSADHIPFLLLNNGLLIPALAMLILALCHRSWLSRPLTHPMIVLLGNSSFAFYLIHLLFNDWTKVYFGPGESLPATFLKLAIITLLALVLHLAVERPCRRMLLQAWRNHHPEPVLASPQARLPKIPG